jgi:dipeptidyl aminopeptidase/acylaminoacyl peptidase
MQKRAVTVADSVCMTRLPASDYGLGLSSEGHVAKFSPDGSRFIIVLQKGNLQNNINEYSLLLFHSSAAFKTPRPEVLLTMSSSSNREAIQNLKWLPDNETVVFMGENPGEVPQVYSFNIRTKRLKKLTNHPTSIIRYDVSNNGRVIIFEADPPIKKTIDTTETRRNGLVVHTQNLLDVLTGDRYPPFTTEGRHLFLMIQGHPATQIKVEDWIDSQMPISLSPNGRYAVIQVFVSDVPKIWGRYQDPHTSSEATRERPKNTHAALFRYMLLDTNTAALTPLLNTPAVFRIGVTWAPDGNSIVVSSARLPLDIEESAECDEREKDVYVLEIRIPGKEVLKIRRDTDNFTAFRTKWEGTKRIFLKQEYVEDRPLRAAYEKDGPLWKEVPMRDEDNKSAAPLNVTLEEDMNTPPRVLVVDPTSQQKTLLLDLNPQFADLDFGRVERVTWNSIDGHEFWGGLFWPPNYVPGTRYPLVIQTHGFIPGLFTMDGMYNPGSAARPLASKGFFVLQVGGFNKTYPSYGEGPQEAPVQMAAYEGAIDSLERRSLIDANLVGLVGFSRTVYYGAYSLTHSKYRFTAAIMADGINAGYFQYISSGGNLMSTFDLLNGGLPWGKTADSWLQDSPGFNLDKVKTPVRLETHGYSGDAPSEWEWFVGLSHLGKPVELIYLPDASHILVKPWERMVSQQGAVDWFTFWLKGEEDSDPVKREQYTRWRDLRKLQEKNEATRPGSKQ